MEREEYEKKMLLLHAQARAHDRVIGMLLAQIETWRLAATQEVEMAEEVVRVMNELTAKYNGWWQSDWDKMWNTEVKDVSYPHHSEA